MNGRPEQPDREEVTYRVSDSAALAAEVERQKRRDRESAKEVLRRTSARRSEQAPAEPEKEQDRKGRVEKALDVSARLRSTEEHFEQNSDDFEAREQNWNESISRTTASGGSRRSHPDREQRGKRAAAALAKRQEALLSATTPTEVLAALGKLLLVGSRRPYAENLVPSPAALHAVRGQVPADVAADVRTAGGISFTVMDAGLGLYEMTIGQVHAKWQQHRDARLQHPLAPLVAWWQEKRGSPPSEVGAVVLQHDERDHVRTPGLMATALLSPLVVVEVDGKPFGSTAPVRVMRLLPAPPDADSEQLLLFPGPRTLDDAAVDPVLAAVSQISDWTDRRSSLRSDLLTLVRLGCAILSPVELDIDGWAQVLRGYPGRVQSEARLRAQRALTAGAVIVWQDKRPYQMVRALTGHRGKIVVHPSAGAGWWQGGRGGGDAWRLSGGLCRPHWTGARQGGHRRMAEGVEAALAWVPPGARSKISAALHPFDDRQGSPGNEYFIGWQRALYLSGEPYPLSTDESAARSFLRRIGAFKDAGYVAQGNAPAPAGDTWEITRIVKGGLWVRASARYVEAVRLSQDQRNFTQVTLDKLLSPEPAAA